MTNVANVKEEIERLLRSTNREGIEALISYLNEEGFFTAPASTKYHGCYEGGLAKHSLGVHECFIDLLNGCSVSVPEGTIIIASLLHDLCKVGAYLGSAKPYAYNNLNPKGHALLSLERVKKFITLSDLETALIEFHMGIYGSREFKATSGEYGVKRMTDIWEMYPAVKLMYFADELATLVEKAEEQK